MTRRFDGSTAGEKRVSEPDPPPSVGNSGLGYRELIDEPESSESGSATGRATAEAGSAARRATAEARPTAGWRPEARPANPEPRPGRPAWWPAGRRRAGRPALGP